MDSVSTTNTSMTCGNTTTFDLTLVRPADALYFVEKQGDYTFYLQVVGKGYPCQADKYNMAAKQLTSYLCSGISGPNSLETTGTFDPATTTLTLHPVDDTSTSAVVNIKCNESLVTPELLSVTKNSPLDFVFNVGWFDRRLCNLPPTPAPTPSPTPAPTPPPTKPPHILDCAYLGPNPMRFDCEGRLLDLTFLYPANSPAALFTGSAEGSTDTKYAVRFAESGLPESLPASTVPKCNKIPADTLLVVGKVSDARCTAAAALAEGSAAAASLDLKLAQFTVNLTAPPQLLGAAMGDGDGDSTTMLTIICDESASSPKIARVAVLSQDPLHRLYALDVRWGHKQICKGGSSTLSPTAAPTPSPTLEPLPCTMSLNPPMFHCSDGSASLELDFSRFKSGSGNNFFVTKDLSILFGRVYIQLLGDGLPFNFSGAVPPEATKYCQFPLDKVVAVAILTPVYACRPLGLLDQATDIFFFPSTRELSMRFLGGEDGASFEMRVACDESASHPALTDTRLSANGTFFTSGRWGGTSLCGLPATTSPTPAPTPSPPSPFADCSYTAGPKAKVQCKSGAEFDLSVFAPEGPGGPAFFSAPGQAANTTFYLQLMGGGLAPSDVNASCAFAADAGVAGLVLNRSLSQSAICAVLGNMDTLVLVQLDDLGDGSGGRQLTLSVYGGDDFRFFTVTIRCHVDDAQQHPVLLAPPAEVKHNVFTFEMGWRHPELCPPPTPPPTPSPTPPPTFPPPTEVFVSAYTYTHCVLGAPSQDGVVWRVGVNPGQQAECREDTSARFWPGKRFLQVGVDMEQTKLTDFRVDCRDDQCVECGLVLATNDTTHELGECYDAKPSGGEAAADRGLTSVMVRPASKPCVGSDLIDIMNVSALLVFYPAAADCRLDAEAVPPNAELYTYVVGACLPDDRLPGTFARLTMTPEGGGDEDTEYELAYDCSNADCSDCAGTLRAREAVCGEVMAAGAKADSGRFQFLSQELARCSRQPLTPAPTPSPTPAPTAGPGRWLVSAYSSADCSLGAQGQQAIIWPVMESGKCTADTQARFWGESRFYMLEEDEQSRAVKSFRADCRDKDCRECGLTLDKLKLRLKPTREEGVGVHVERTACEAAQPVNTTSELGLQAFTLRNVDEACVGSDEIATAAKSAVVAYFSQATDCNLATGTPNVQLFSYVYDTCLPDPRVANKFYLLTASSTDAQVLELVFGCNSTCGACSSSLRGRIGRCLDGLAAETSIQILSQSDARCANQPFPPPPPTGAPTTAAPTTAPTIEPGSGAEFFVSVFAGSATCNLGAGSETALMWPIRNTGGECQIDPFHIAMEDMYNSLELAVAGGADGDGGMKLKEMRLSCEDPACMSCAMVVTDASLESCVVVVPAADGAGIWKGKASKGEGGAAAGDDLVAATPAEFSLSVTSAARSCVEGKNVSESAAEAGHEALMLVLYPAATECSLDSGVRNAIIATFPFGDERNAAANASTACLDEQTTPSGLDLGPYVRISRLGQVDTLAYKCDKNCSRCNRTLSAVRGQCQPAQLVASDRFQFLRPADLGKACPSPEARSSKTEEGLIIGVSVAGGLLLAAVAAVVLFVLRQRRSSGAGGGGGGGRGGEVESERTGLLAGVHGVSTASSNV